MTSEGRRRAWTAAPTHRTHPPLASHPTAAAHTDGKHSQDMLALCTCSMQADNTVTKPIRVPPKRLKGWKGPRFMLASDGGTNTMRGSSNARVTDQSRASEGLEGPAWVKGRLADHGGVEIPTLGVSSDRHTLVPAIRCTAPHNVTSICPLPSLHFLSYNNNSDVCPHGQPKPWWPSRFERSLVFLDIQTRALHPSASDGLR